MGFGIGLGSFVSGMAGGYQAGSKMRDDFQDRRNKGAMIGIEKQGKQEFDAIKAKDPSADFDRFYTQTVIPRKIEQMRTAGDDAGAARYEAWATERGNKEAATLFGSGMIKGQAGDMGGAINDFVAAGKSKGYLNHGFDILGSDPVKDYDGKVTGYKVRMKDAAGKESVQQFNSADEILQFGASVLNPDAAFASWQAGKAKAADNATDMEKEKIKLGLKREDDLERKKIGLGKEDPGKVFDDAVKTLSADPNWGLLKPEEQQAKIEAHLSQRQAAIGKMSGGEGGGSATAAPAGPKGRVLVDTVTGQPVGGPEAAAANPAAGNPAAAAPGINGTPEQSWLGRVGGQMLGNLASGPGGPKQNVFASEEQPAAQAQSAPEAGPEAPPAAPRRAIGLGPASAQAAEITAPNRPEAIGLGNPPLPRANPGREPAVEPQATIADPGLESLRQQLGQQQQRVLTAAVNAVRTGADKNMIIQQLQQAGIPAELWPF